MATTTATSPRLHYFDMIKGVAIFLVVMGHVITMCVREVDRTALFKFIGEIHMPLFFFISGWFTYKVSEGRVVIPALGQRAVRLLLPMVVVSTLWIYYFPHSGLESPLESTFEGLWFNAWKNGYWFTLVLFEIIAVYAATARLLQWSRNVYGATAVMLCVWVVLLLVYKAVPAGVDDFLSIGLVAAFYPAFMFGALARRYRDGFMRAVHNSTCQTVALLVTGVCMYVCCWPWEFGIEADSFPIITLRAVMHMALAVIALAVFERWEHRAYAPDARPLTRGIASMWEYVGTKSLGIYLLHYFFLFPMGALFREPLIGLKLTLVPMIVFSGFWAACIIAVVLGFMKVISVSRPLDLMLTGTK